MTSALMTDGFATPASHRWDKNCSLKIWPNWLLTEDLNIVRSSFLQMTSKLFIHDASQPASERGQLFTHGWRPHRLVTDEMKIVRSRSDVTRFWQWQVKLLLTRERWMINESDLPRRCRQGHCEKQIYTSQKGIVGHGKWTKSWKVVSI